MGKDYWQRILNAEIQGYREIEIIDDAIASMEFPPATERFKLSQYRSATLPHHLDLSPAGTGGILELFAAFLRLGY